MRPEDWRHLERQGRAWMAEREGDRSGSRRDPARIGRAPEPTAPAAGGGHCVHGAGRDLRPLISTHLFAITLNHSGSTFLRKALATARNTWNLPREGVRVLGYAGPVVGRGSLAGAHKIWASRRRWRKALTNPDAYDWRRTRKAWYFQASARNPRASVFVTKSPPHLLVVDELARHFPDAKFLFMVRNPYAVCEGICRSLERRGLGPANGALPEAAARHVVACLRYQRRNIDAHGTRGLAFTYERLCREPERLASEMRALVSELDDLVLRRRLLVKGRYDETLTDMNARHVARLRPAQAAALDRVFRPHRGLLREFGYELMG